MPGGDCFKLTRRRHGGHCPPRPADSASVALTGTTHWPGRIPADRARLGTVIIMIMTFSCACNITIAS
jgi:hypothetical protein